MIDLIYNNINIPVSNFIVHYVEDKSDSGFYKLKIPVNETKIVRLIESYSSCKIDNPDLQNKVIESDKRNRSMGLLWKLKVNFFDKIEPSFSSDVFPVFNNIKKIFVEGDFLLIEGEAS